MKGKKAFVIEAGASVLAVAGIVAVSIGAMTAMDRGASATQASSAASAKMLAESDACTLIVPRAPLTAKGLATPYQLSGTGCAESTQDQAAFVQAAWVDPMTGKIQVYNPLVITAGDKPAVTPIPPKLPAGAVVAIWFGSNGASLPLSKKHMRKHFMLANDAGSKMSLGNGKCVNGSGGTLFGQFAYCNAPAFFTAANAAIAAKKLVVPNVGTAKDGQACPTVRDFFVVDQDQSDNVTGSYLVTPSGSLAQDTTVNRKSLGQYTVMSNGSDEGLLANHIDPALGCTPWTAPDAANGGAMTTALPLNELQARVHQAAPSALVPDRDPMVLVNGQPNLAKLNAYRAGVGQPAVSSLSAANAQQVQYCTNLLKIAPARLAVDKTLLSAASSPTPGFATLYDFMLSRYNFTVSTDGINCPTA